MATRHRFQKFCGSCWAELLKSCLKGGDLGPLAWLATRTVESTRGTLPVLQHGRSRQDRWWKSRLGRTGGAVEIRLLREVGHKKTTMQMEASAVVGSVFGDVFGHCECSHNGLCLLWSGGILSGSTLLSSNVFRCDMFLCTCHPATANGAPGMRCAINHLDLGLTSSGWSPESRGGSVPLRTILCEMTRLATLVASSVGSGSTAAASSI